MHPQPCPHYPDCVGCPLIGTAYGEQLRQKAARVQAALARHPRLAHVSPLKVIGSPRAFGYRNQAKLVVRRAQRGTLLGIYRPGSHQVVDITRCPVHLALVAGVLPEMRAQIERHAVPAYDERTGEGWLRYVIARASEFQRAVQLILVVRDRRFAGERAFLHALRALRGVRSVVLNLNPAPGNVIFGDAFVPVTREGALIDRVGGFKLKSHAGAFMQANLGAARRVYDRVLAWADPQPEEVAIDLYAGVGAISFALATRAARVYGIEESPIAVRSAKENIRLNGFHNVRFYAGGAAQVLPTLSADLGRIDLCTLNPPRQGADEATRRAIIACAPRCIVYVSCDPETLARDLDWFAGHGYATDALQPFDLLPQTAHVECVARVVATASA